MRCCGIGFDLSRRHCGGLALLILAAAITSRAFGQAQPPTETFKITAEVASTWDAGISHVVQLTGGVSIQTDDATMSAQSAVIWLSPVPGELRGQQRAEIALIGDAKLQHAQASRSGGRLFVTALLRGQPQLSVQRSAIEDASNSDLYRAADELRRGAATLTSGQLPAQWILEPPGTQPTTTPASQPAVPANPVHFSARNVVTTLSASGKLAYVLSGDVLLTDRKSVV